jgi:hypothetical protein
MNALESQKYLGKQASLSIDGLIVSVSIMDVKRSYGTLRFLISGGFNSTWVNADRVSVQA